MNIAIDGNEANIKNRVGSNVYAFELLAELEKSTRNRRDLHFYILLDSPAISELPLTREGWKYRVVTPRKLWTQFALPIHLFAHRASYDVFFTPGHYAPRFSPLPYVSTVMDVAFLKYPQQFRKKDLIQLTKWTKYSVKHAAKIVAISDSTKRDVMLYYHRLAEDIVVAPPAVHPPITLPSKKVAELIEKKGITQPFFVYIGTIQPRKNLVRLVQAFEQLKSQLATDVSATQNEKNVQLVIAGKIGWLAEDLLAAIEKSPWKKSVLQLGFVDAETKQALLQTATATVLVGLYEGFGIPPLESLHVGTIPVVSSTSSLPEVVGKAGILVDPTNCDSIQTGLLKALRISSADKQQLQQLALHQTQLFSWSKTAALILDTLENVRRS